MKYYFIKDLQGVFEREEAVDTSEFPQFVELTPEQVAIYLAHPSATRYEIEHSDDSAPGQQEEEPQGDLLEEARLAKLAALNEYDSSEAVNSFVLGNLVMWIFPEERSNYMLTIQSAEALGVDTLPYKGMAVPTAVMKQMLYRINLYAAQCTAVTAAHKAAIEACESVAEVEAYDFTAGYPEKLTFDMPSL